MQRKPIRAFARGLAVLLALNRHGSATALTLARESGVPRATVYRLLQTLLDEGYVGRGTADDRFHLRLKVRGLSEGFEDEQWISEIAVPALEDLTRRIAWPCDVSTLDGLKMVIHNTTHRLAPLSIDRNVVGRELPILASSPGRAYIAFAPKEETEAYRCSISCLVSRNGSRQRLTPSLALITRAIQTMLMHPSNRLPTRIGKASEPVCGQMGPPCRSP
jgi:IclR family mhp operon transcriptional activator